MIGRLNAESSNGYWLQRTPDHPRHRAADFGAKRLRTIGSDLGGAVKGFKKAMDEGEENEKKQLASPDEKDADFDSTPASKTGGKSTHA
jgi:sec-independent protein translocase protein TatA